MLSGQIIISLITLHGTGVTTQATTMHGILIRYTLIKITFTFILTTTTIITT